MLTTKDYVNYENTIVKERENPPPTGSTAPSIDNEVLLKSSQQNAIVSIILITGGVVMITKIIKKTIRKA